jgi:hypothetical protein
MVANTPTWTLLKLDYNPATRLLALSYKKDKVQTGYMVDVYAVPSDNDLNALHVADHCLVITPKKDGLLISEIGDVNRGIDERPETILFSNPAITGAITAFHKNCGDILESMTTVIAWQGTVFEPAEIPTP